jgi:hypothetical protein
MGNVPVLALVVIAGVMVAVGGAGVNGIMRGGRRAFAGVPVALVGFGLAALLIYQLLARLVGGGG